MQEFGRQNPRRRAVAPAQIPQGRRPKRVVALQKLLNPALAKRGHRGNLAGRMPLRQKPDRLKMPRRHNVLASLVPRLQRLNAQMTGHVRHARPPANHGYPIYQQKMPTRIHPVESIRRNPYYYFSSDRMVGDIDNIVKPILDAMVRIAYADDREVERVTVQRFEPLDQWEFSDPSAQLVAALDNDPPVVYIRVDDDLSWRRL